MSLVARISLVCLAILLGAHLAAADEVLFKNGDRLTGKIVSAADGKLIIDTKLAGKITVKIQDIKTFRTDAPLKIRMQDGSFIDQKIVPAADGSVIPLVGPITKPVAIPLAKVAKINEEEPHWTGSIVANASFARSNSKSEQFGLTTDAVRKSDTDQINLDGAYLYGRSKVPGEPERTDTDNWFTAAKYEDFLTKKAYVYTNVRVEKDRINFLNLRLTPGVGVGYNWIDKPDFHFHTEAGLAYVYEQLDNGGGTNENASARLAYHVDKNFYDGHLNVYNDVEFFPGFNDSGNFLLLTTAGLRTPITDKLFSEIKIVVNYDSSPGPQAKRTDEKLLVGVGYKF